MRITIPPFLYLLGHARKVFHNLPPTTINDGVTFNDYVVPANLSYETNAWGRVSKNVKSYREQAQASAADLAVVNLSLHASLAVDYSRHAAWTLKKSC